MSRSVCISVMSQIVAARGQALPPLVPLVGDAHESKVKRLFSVHKRKDNKWIGNI